MHGLVKFLINFLKNNYIHTAIFFTLIISYYYFYLQNLDTDFMRNFWREYFIPYNPAQWHEYMMKKAIPIFVERLFPNLIFAKILFFSFSVGCFIMAYHKPYFFMVLFFPILSTFLANFIVYPPESRLLLFLVPNIILISSWPYSELLQKLLTKYNCYKSMIFLICGIIVALILYALFINSRYLYRQQYKWYQHSELLKIISENYLPKDKLYFVNNEQLGLMPVEYKKNFLKSFPQYSVLPSDLNIIIDTIEQTKLEARIFVFFDHFSSFPKEQYSNFENKLRSLGYSFIKIKQTNSTILLYIIDPKQAVSCENLP